MTIVVVMISGEGFDQIRVAFARRDAANHQDVGHAVSVFIQHVQFSLDGLKLLDVMKGRNDETSLFSSAVPQQVFSIVRGVSQVDVTPGAHNLLDLFSPGPTLFFMPEADAREELRRRDVVILDGLPALQLAQKFETLLPPD